MTMTPTALSMYVVPNFEKKPSRSGSPFEGMVLPYISRIDGIPLVFKHNDSIQIDWTEHREPIPAGLIGVSWRFPQLWIGVGDGLATMMPAGSAISFIDRDVMPDEDVIAAVNRDISGTTIPYLLAYRAFGADQYIGKGRERDRLAGLLRLELPSVIQRLKRAVEAEASAREDVEDRT